MVTVNNLISEYNGLSTDTKPIDGVRNGSVFNEIDSGKVFIYDEENARWIEQASSGGSGGGGDDSETTVTIYDGDVELQTSGEGFAGAFTPITAPKTGENLTVVFNGQTYELQDIAAIVGSRTSVWANTSNVEEVAIVISPSDGMWYIQTKSELMPSQDSPQTLPVVITQVQSSGGDDSETTVTIYDGNVELSAEGNGFSGMFTPTAEPKAGENLTVVFNGQTYELLDVSGTLGMPAWMDEPNYEEMTIYVARIDGIWSMGATSQLMPSQDSPQTLPVVITQVQSSSGSGDSDFSVANVTFINSGSSYILTCPYVDEDYMTVDRYGITTEMTLQIPLYKGLFILGFNNVEDVDFSVMPTISGGIRMVDSQFEITGDGTITMEGNANPPS